MLQPRVPLPITIPPHPIIYPGSFTDVPAGKFEHAFGYFVARCKMPKQPGHWPAFWLMCAGVGKVGNEGRDGTEIDIVEMPWRDGKITSALHWDGYGTDHKSAASNITLPELTEGFHNYALHWTPEEYVFYVNDREVWRTRAGGVTLSRT